MENLTEATVMEVLKLSHAVSLITTTDWILPLLCAD